MTRRQVVKTIRLGADPWTLVMEYPDGELGCIDASGRAAETLMQRVPQFVVGIYRPEQASYLWTDLKRRANPVWEVEAA